MDVSELAPNVLVALVLAVFIALFVLAGRLRSWWLRWPARSGAVVGVALSALALVLLGFNEYSCTARAPLAYSPDGKHVAILTWGLHDAASPACLIYRGMAGGWLLGLDIASVNVRNRWIPYANTAYSGPGWSDYPEVRDTDPQIRWIDNNHLLIRYHDAYGQKCGHDRSGVEVICEHLPVPFTPSSHSK